MPALLHPFSISHIVIYKRALPGNVAALSDKEASNYASIHQLRHLTLHTPENLL